MSTPDQIVKKTVLKAPRDRVWDAVSDATKYGAWFGCQFDGSFTAGAKLTGTMVPTKADPEIAAKQNPYRGRTFAFEVERVEPQKLISFRWHPAALDGTIDYSKEPTTLIVFELADAPGGHTQLTITESGFENIPLARRADAFRMNDGGWTMQVQLIEKYLAL
jgi:uncharacterized protein YndB with AHSA1/START domain